MRVPKLFAHALAELLSKARITITRSYRAKKIFYSVPALIVFALVVNAIVQLQNAKDMWQTKVQVLVATRTFLPGEQLSVGSFTSRSLPRIGVPTNYLKSSQEVTTSRQTISAGAIVTNVDVSTLSGPAALLPNGWQGIGVGDAAHGIPLNIGDRVAVLAAGSVVAREATVIAINDGAYGNSPTTVIGLPEHDVGEVTNAIEMGAITLSLLP